MHLDVFSPELPVTIGDPQGSNLGALLFINDSSNILVQAQPLFWKESLREVVVLNKMGNKYAINNAVVPYLWFYVDLKET